jgi:hypothetical protein
MNRLSNAVFDSSYPDGFYVYAWNLSYRCITTQCSGLQRGTWGYYVYRYYALSGNASGDNMGVFLQDTWTVNKHITFNLGLRTERELVPNYPANPQIPSTAIEFSWRDKLAPRLGFAYDPRGDGRMKIYGSWGRFYDLMKYEMPRGEFGGLNNWAYVYALDDPNLVYQLRGIPAEPTKLPGRFLEKISYFLPYNDPSLNWVDPDLEPMQQATFDIGFDYSLRPSLVLSLRYTDRRLIRTIEDIGTIASEGESYRSAIPVSAWWPIRPPGMPGYRQHRRPGATTAHSKCASTGVSPGNTSSR